MALAGKGKLLHDWQRFWCPHREGASITLEGGGYLREPTDEYGGIYNPHVRTFGQMASSPCLILLGEPGIGKSVELQKEYDKLAAGRSNADQHFLKFDLRDFGDVRDLCQEVFGDSVFEQWARGTDLLDLFFDSLDEALMTITPLATRLVRELTKYDCKRLRLRIACRTAEWPDILENGLRGLWPEIKRNGKSEDQLELYELAPLRRVDVGQAAEANGVDAAAFLGEVENREVVPFATKPVTLSFLLGQYLEGTGLPLTKSEVYKSGCRQLCEEKNPSRIASARTGTLTCDQLMAVAARIAAILAFANRSAISIPSDSGGKPKGDLPINELPGWKEAVRGISFDVAEPHVKEAIATGLFSAKGPNRMGWAHQTYGEFLAAWYVKNRGMAHSQVRSLIQHPEGRIVPQLREVAAWLAAMDHKVSGEIVDADPELLLRSDTAQVGEELRAELTEVLLRKYDEGSLLDVDWDLRNRYRKLLHPRIADQLQPYICDRNKGEVVRRVAIGIAGECGVPSLADDLVKIALDQSESLYVRKYAAYALCDIDDDGPRAKLKPLALGLAGDDPEDELKGCGLRAVWPNHMSTEELFSVLTRPKRSNLIGAYSSFLWYGVVSHLRSGDLPVALEWVHQLGRVSVENPLQRLTDSIVRKAWENLESPHILGLFAKVALARLQTHDEIVGTESAAAFREELDSNQPKRHRLVEAMIPMIQEPKNASIGLFFSGMLRTEDLPWMIDHLLACRSENTQRVWARLIRWAYSYQNADHLSAIIEGGEKNSIMREEFADLLNAVPLNSPEADTMRTTHREMQEWERKRKVSPRRPGVRAIRRITTLLDEFDSGNVDAWWQMNVALLADPDGISHGRELDSDLRDLPGWKAIDDAARKRIVTTAKDYILQGCPQIAEWLGKDTPHRPALAGYKAFRLLLQQTADSLSDIPPAIWQRWAPAIIGYPMSNTVDDVSDWRRLVKMASQHAPDEIVEALKSLIDRENQERDSLFVTWGIEDCRDDRLAAAMLDKAKRGSMKPECMGSILRLLLNWDFAPAKEFAASLVSSRSPSQGKVHPQTLAAASALMGYGNDAGWSILWPAIQQDKELGRLLVERTAFPHTDMKTLGPRLREDQVADLFIWTERQYPHAEDPEYDFVHSVGTRELVGHWRNGLLQHLADRGTEGAVAAVRRIMQEFPDYDWLKWTLYRAQEKTRSETFVWPEPSHIIQLAQRADSRFLHGGDQLLETIVESLGRLQEKLHAEVAMVQFLWDKDRPKEEEALSNWVANHLREDVEERGIITNREVQIHRKQKTDVHVDAIVVGDDGQPRDTVSVIIEVKGCWHKELYSAMQTQLLDRYLKDNPCEHGLYLVGWFNCDEWSNKDPRKKLALEHGTLDEVRESLEAQAADLSTTSALRIRTLVIDASFHQ